MAGLIRVIQYVFQILTILVIVDVFIGYFLSPYHGVRLFLDRIVEPMLAPIRKIIPQTGMIDFSPFVLLIVLYILELVIISLLRGL